MTTNDKRMMKPTWSCAGLANNESNGGGGKRWECTGMHWQWWQTMRVAAVAAAAVAARHEACYADLLTDSNWTQQRRRSRCRWGVHRAACDSAVTQRSKTTPRSDDATPRLPFAFYHLPCQVCCWFSCFLPSTSILYPPACPSTDTFEVGQARARDKVPRWDGRVQEGKAQDSVDSVRRGRRQERKAHTGRNETHGSGTSNSKTRCTFLNVRIFLK